MVLDNKAPSIGGVPWADSDITPWNLPDGLLELTARDIWGFLKTHPNFRDVDLKAFYQSLVDKSYCSGLGPVVSHSDVENALVKVISFVSFA